MNLQRPAKVLDQMPKRPEAKDVFDVSRMKKPVDHVKNEKCLHAVVGKTFPSLGEGDVAESARMSDKTAVLRIVHEAK